MSRKSKCYWDEYSRAATRFSHTTSRPHGEQELETEMQRWVAVVVMTMLSTTGTWASERYFTYTYEPETMLEGAAEFEQWVTLRTQRTDDVGQRNYNRWEIREEFEYGVTDNYTMSLYLNTKAESFRDPLTGNSESEFEFAGVSLENRYMLLNPGEHAVGLALYLEPTYSGEEAEVEQKIIIGQRCGDWKWAFNLSHETEWELNEHETEGVLEFNFGITRHLNSRWSIGLEARNHNEIPEYNDWESTAFFVGPVVAYKQENWWATLTALPQVWGKHTSGGPDPDGVSGLELKGHERVNIRLIFGIDL